MRVLHVVWGALSIALAFWINHMMEPRVDRARDATDLSTATGRLALRRGAASHEFALVTLRPLVQDIVYPFGKRIEIRELSVRSTGERDPDLELFVDLSGTAANVSSREVQPWMSSGLPIVAATFGGLKSHVRLPGRADPLGVVEGEVTITEVRALGASESGMQRWRVRGGLVLTLLDQGEIQQGSGDLEAVVSW